MDVKVVETFNGGDLVKLAKDLHVIYGLTNMPYLALFGGNVQASTPSKRIPTEQAFDYWGNLLFMGEEPGQQFNSETERALMNTPLTSAGRLIIEQAIKNDLKFMKDFAVVAVAVSIVATDKVIIGIHVQEPDNIQSREFIILWDATRNELEEITTGGGTTAGVVELLGFDYTLDFSFI